MTDALRIFVRSAVLLLFVVLWLWLADRFFDSPTTDFNPQHERGFAALIEQIGAALYTPAWFVWEFAFGAWRARSQTLDRAPLFVLLLLQLWPAYILAFRRWHRFSRTLRMVVIGYSGVCLLAVVTGFIVLHRSWDRMFGP